MSNQKNVLLDIAEILPVSTKIRRLNIRIATRVREMRVFVTQVYLDIGILIGAGVS